MVEGAPPAAAELPRISLDFRRTGPAARGSRPADRLGLLDQRLGLANGGEIDELAVESDGAAPRLRRLRHVFEDAPGAPHLLFGGAEALVGERHLRGVDRPFALAAQRRRPPRRGAVAVGIGEIAEGA